MYPIRLIVVGKTKMNPTILLENHYKKLIKTWVRLETVEVREGRGRGDRGLSEEAAAIGAALAGHRRRVLLRPGGAGMDSVCFAKWLGTILDRGESLAFAIGSGGGFHASLAEAGHEALSLGPMTFPHDLCRVIFLEQLYRALTIIKGKVYHK